MILTCFPGFVSVCPVSQRLFHCGDTSVVSVGEWAVDVGLSTGTGLEDTSFLDLLGTFLAGLHDWGRLKILENIILMIIMSYLCENIDVNFEIVKMLLDDTFINSIFL